jgi:hypothetical protein
MNLTQQISPFDSSVNARLHRMGLLQDDSSPHEKAIAAFGRLHAALFFDDLLDAKQELADILLLATAYQALLQAEEYRKLFVLYSWQYDTMKKTLPPTAWWIAGNNELIRIFMKAFIPEFIAFLQHDEFGSGRQEGGDAS